LVGAARAFNAAKVIVNEPNMKWIMITKKYNVILLTRRAKYHGLARGYLLKKLLR